MKMKTKGAGLFNTLNLKHIEKMAENGMSRQQIGDYYGCTGSNIGQLIKKHPDLDECFSRGLSKGIEKATNKLMELIEEKNLIAILFYLKTQGKWKEAQYDREPVNDNQPKVMIYLPDNGRDKVIEGESVVETDDLLSS
jgi:hypothetical protein